MSGAYNTFEQSIQAAAPVELYRFVGSLKNYFYTSADTTVVFSATTYQPLAIRRTAVRAGTQSEDGLSLELELPFDCQLVRDYAYTGSPQKLSLEVYRIHREGNINVDFVLMWKGKVASFAVEGRTCKIRVPSIFARALEGEVPNAYYQNPCNHVLFDQGCQLSRVANTATSTITVAGTSAITVVDDGWPNGHLVAGEVVNLRTNERRLVLSNVDNTVTVSSPFTDVQIGDTVQLVRGCNHSYSQCVSRFNNGINYGGHKDVPSDNPFSGSIG